MKSKYRYIEGIALGGVGAFLCFYLFSGERISQSGTPASANQKRAYFSTIPLTMTSENAPHVLTTIDDESFSMLLTGLQGAFSLLSNHLEKISSKNLVRTEMFYNFRGTGHLCHFYTVPKVSIGAALWWDPIIQERTEEYARETRINRDENDPIDQLDGAIGWLLFREMNLFLDLGNSKAVICDGLNTLREHGYRVDAWVQTPLLTDRGMVEIGVTTPQGLTRCLLDTGTTWNILNNELPGKSFAEACFDSSNLIEYSSFKIGETDLGPIVFH